MEIILYNFYMMMYEMSEFRRGKGGRGGRGRGRGSVGVLNDNSGTTSSFRPSPQSQTHPETGESSNPRQGQSTDSRSSRIVVESSHPTPETENTGADDIERAVGPGSRDSVNYCGFIMRSTISLRDGDWDAIISKYREVMWMKAKDKFEARGTREHVLQAPVINTMRRLSRSWKTRLHKDYSKYDTDEGRLSHRPNDVMLEDWVFLAVSEWNKINRGKQITKHSCGSRSFAEVEESTRDPESGEKATADRVWELQHTRKNDQEELVWSDIQSQQIHGQLQELVIEQQSEEIEKPMSGEEILATVLGERSGYVRGKGYGKRPTKKVVCSR
ncbi:hypothetical protein RND71_026362 [Anisodus tanguticus]|uniref:Uncharacterized protein n=1 Tax=Anisodus tanguticus TaxID=243964 RepID=A0AAE1RNR8_9SOLA|nr:hypothetical protein RND71_026362 [Anisodus tanguticus]